jgi:hypothetical protein
MTVFAKRTIDVFERVELQNQIAALALSEGGPHDVMMLLARGRGMTDDVYIGLPNAKLLSAFVGFIEVARDSLPDYLSTIYAREDGFEEQFPDIYKKRRTRFGK